MASLYDTLRQRYGLTDKYPTISFEEEKKQIKLYQSKTTPKYIKDQIIEQFWNMNKARIVQQAIKLYSYLVKSFYGNMNIEIDELIQKGSLAITHCLNIYHKCSKKPKESNEEFKARKSKIEETRFGTLLQWWIRPFIIQRINHENFMIYVPHSKNTEKKSVAIDSLDSIKFENSNKTNADYLPADETQTPDKLLEREMFWDTIKEHLSKEEYTFLEDWIFIKTRYKTKKAFYLQYNMSMTQVNDKLEEIKKKLVPIMQDWRNAF